MTTRFVSYARVSTDKQGRSGLGLEAQEAAIKAHLAGTGGTLVASFVEVESGKRADRPELCKAIAHAKLTGAVLLIAKLDRLSRDAHFLLGLSKSGVEFVAADMPSATRLTVGIMAMVAEEEARLISARTKAALAAAKARGVKLGNPQGAKAIKDAGHHRKATAAVVEAATCRAEAVRETIDAIRTGGVTSANGIARVLNERHIATARGGQWTARSVINVLERL
ncbi:MAG: recombinase family protein [Burkholderiales bacterium]|nr:recombinase family protein [Burkholderiales bacterium]